MPLLLFVLVLGMIVQGIAKSTRNPFSTTYVDDNGKKKKTAMYMGMWTIFTHVLRLKTENNFSSKWIPW